MIDVRAIIQQKSQDITVSTTCSPTGCCSAIATRGIDGRANTSEHVHGSKLPRCRRDHEWCSSIRSTCCPDIRPTKKQHVKQVQVAKTCRNG